MKIKLIILDVDGVIVGEKVGYNSPYPHPDVISRLKSVRKKGIYISLCTAKPHFSIRKIITDAGLDNPHITNGGSVIIDPLDNTILKKHVINKDKAIRVIKAYLNKNVYTEFYSVANYYIQKNQIRDLTKTHTHILQKEPSVVNSLTKEANKHEIVKIMPIAQNEEDKKRLSKIFDSFKDVLTLSWGVHPVALPHQFGIITAKNISKKEGALGIANSLNVTTDNMLGIGDSTSDWQFIDLCKYAGTMGNASMDLKDLVKTKGKDNFIIGKSVDENGILNILDYFSL